MKMNRMRQRIAARLKEAQNTNAMLTTFNEIDLLFDFILQLKKAIFFFFCNFDSSFSNVMQMRKKYQDAFTKKHGVKLGLMSPFVRASAIALQDLPVVNAG